VALADELARLIALKDAGHLSDEEFQAAKDAVLGKPGIDQPMTAAHHTEVIQTPPSGDEAHPPLATHSKPTWRSRRPLLAALAVLSVLLAGGVYAFNASRSTTSRSSTAASPTAATSPEASPSPISINASSFKDALFVKDCNKAGGQSRTQDITTFNEIDASGGKVAGAIVVGVCSLGGDGDGSSQVYDYVESPTGLTLDKTLIAAEERLTWQASSVASDHLEMRFKGYSSADIPKCCPDIDVTRSFSWDPEMSWLDDNPPAPSTVAPAPTEQYVLVPDIVGLDERRAQSVLIQARLRLGFSTYTNGDPSLAARTNQACTIVRQQPAPGVQVLRNSPVKVLEDCPPTGSY